MRLRPLPATTALILSAVCFFAGTPASWAQPAPAPAKAATSAPAKAVVTAGSGVAWTSLTPSQRQALAPLERDWPGIEASRRTKWIEIANRFPSMPVDERQRMQERMTEWARLTPDERGRARLSFQEAKQLSPQERQARWEAYQALPEEDRKALATRAQDKRERPGAAAASTPMAAVPKQPSASAAAVTVKPVAPTVVQAKPGATTTLMTKTPSPPAHQKPGQPKIDAQPDQVDRTTLLPQRGPQGSGARAAAAQPASAAASGS